MEMVETEHHGLPDGRTLAICRYGDPGGVPIFYAHGSPGSRLEGAIFQKPAEQYGFCLICTDRPGIGGSTFNPGRKLLDYPEDMRQLADGLGIEAFGLIGWSGGGAHTLACAYALAERTLFTISLCGYTSFTELPGAADMLGTKADRISVGLSHKAPRLFQLFFDLMALSIRVAPGAYYNETAKALNASDQEIMADEAFKAHFIRDQTEAFVQGSRGVTLDAAVHYIDWGFRLSEIGTKVHVFHGSEDHLVPAAFGKHLGENIPDCELHLLEGQGHLFPVTHQKLIFETARAEL